MLSWLNGSKKLTADQTQIIVHQRSNSELKTKAKISRDLMASESPITYNSCGIDSRSDNFQSNLVLSRNDHILLFGLVTQWILVWTELHVGWNGLEAKEDYRRFESMAREMDLRDGKWSKTMVRFRRTCRLCWLASPQHRGLPLWTAEKRWLCSERDTQRILDLVEWHPSRFDQLLWPQSRNRIFPCTFLPLPCRASVWPFPSAVDQSIADARESHVRGISASGKLRLGSRIFVLNANSRRTPHETHVIKHLWCVSYYPEWGLLQETLGGRWNSGEMILFSLTEFCLRFVDSVDGSFDKKRRGEN